MQIFIDNLWEYLFISLLSGLILGIIYDFTSKIPYKIRRKKYSVIGDLLFSLAWGFVYFVISYNKNYGSFRLFSLAAIFSAFYIYKFTIGKYIFRFEYFLLNFIYSITIHISLKIKNVLDNLIFFVKIKYRRNLIKKYNKQLISKFRKEYYENYRQ